MKKSAILKVTNFICFLAIPTTTFIGFVNAVMHASDNINIYEESQAIKERVYNEYITTDEFSKAQLEYSAALNQSFQNGTIDNKKYQEGISYMTSKEFAYEMLENTEYSFLKNEYLRAETLSQQSDESLEKAKNTVIIAGSVLAGSILGWLTTKGLIKIEEKKQIPEAQEKSHQICKKALDQDSSLEK